MKSRLATWTIVAALVAVAVLSLWYRHHSACLEKQVANLEQPAQPSDLQRMKTASAQHRKTASAGHYLPTDFPESAQRVMNDKLNYWDRTTALKDFVRNLSDDDLGALVEFLKHASPEDKDAWARALKNAIMDYLCKKNAKGLNKLLSQIYLNGDEDLVVRDYALQHLIEYNQAMAQSGDERASDLKQTSEVLWQAVKETDSSLAGTALMGLSRLSDISPSIDRQQVAETALLLVEDDQTGELTRTTALQVCAQMGVTNALPAIWQIAQTGETLPLQVSAIAALGLLNDKAATPYLQQIMNGAEDSLKPAARQSLVQLAEYEYEREAQLKEQMEKPLQEEFERRKARNHSSNN